MNMKSTIPEAWCQKIEQHVVQRTRIYMQTNVPKQAHTQLLEVIIHNKVLWPLKVM